MRLFLVFLCVLAFTLSCSKKSSDSSDDGTAGKSYDYKTTGTAAADLLGAAQYQGIIVEISYMPGYAPDDQLQNTIRSFLSMYCNKPNGIVISPKEITGTGSATLSIEEVAALEKQQRKYFTSGNLLTLHLLITDGGYSDPKVLGVAYFNTSMCLFGKTIAGNSGGLGQVSRPRLEATVVTHELGHLLGLVGMAKTSGTHESTDHPKHCTNKDCLMYYASETTDILGFLGSSAIPTLDEDCKNDLKLNGGK